MPLDELVFKQQRAAARGGSGNRWKATEGKNKFRVFRFRHKVTPEDVKKGLFPKEKLGKVLDLLSRPITIHFGLNENRRPTLSNPEIMEAYNRLNKSSSEADKKQAEAIRPSKRFPINIVDMTDASHEMKVWNCPPSAFDQITDILDNEEYGGHDRILDGTGRDFWMVYDPKAAPAKQYRIQIGEKDKSARLDPEISKKATDFYSDAGWTSLGIQTEAGSIPSKSGESEDEEKSEKKSGDEDPF